MPRIWQATVECSCRDNALVAKAASLVGRTTWRRASYEGEVHTFESYRVRSTRRERNGIGFGHAACLLELRPLVSEIRNRCDNDIGGIV